MEDNFLTSTNYNQHNMQEVGRIIADNPQKIIDLLESNDYEVDPSISALELGEAYIYELPNSDGLKLGTSYLLAKQNSSFSGNVHNEDIYDIFDTISDYWDEDENNELTSNAAGLIAGVVSGGLGVTQKILEGQQKKKYGALDFATKQANSRQAIISGILAQKQAQAQAEQRKVELQAKKQKTTIIAVSSVIAVLLIVGTIIYVRRRNG